MNNEFQKPNGVGVDGFYEPILTEIELGGDLFDLTAKHWMPSEVPTAGFAWKRQFDQILGGEPQRKLIFKRTDHLVTDIVDGMIQDPMHPRDLIAIRHWKPDPDQIDLHDLVDYSELMGLPPQMEERAQDIIARPQDTDEHYAVTVISMPPKESLYYDTLDFCMDLEGGDLWSFDITRWKMGKEDKRSTEFIGEECLMGTDQEELAVKTAWFTLQTAAYKKGQEIFTGDPAGRFLGR